MTVHAAHGPVSHRRPHPIRRAAHTMSLRIPRAVNVVWDAAEDCPRTAAVLALLVLGVAGLLFRPLLAVAAAIAVTAVVLRAAYAARIASLTDRLDAAEHKAEAVSAYAAHTDADVRRLQQDAAARMNATSMTVRLPAVEDGQEDGR